MSLDKITSILGDGEAENLLNHKAKVSREQLHLPGSDFVDRIGASFAPNPIYFDPENIVKLAIDGGCNAVASTLGVLGIVARKYAHKIPFILKFNHNELLRYPNQFDQVMFASIEQARDLGAVAVGATIYFGSDESTRQIVEVSEAFNIAHEMGMATILWCYLRNSAFKKGGVDYHTSGYNQTETS